MPEARWNSPRHGEELGQPRVSAAARGAEGFVQRGNLVCGDVLDPRPFSWLSTTVHLFHLFTRLQRVPVKCTHMPSLQRFCTDLRRRAQPRQGGKISSFPLRMGQMPVVTVHGWSEFLQTLPFSHQARGRLPPVS